MPNTDRFSDLEKAAVEVLKDFVLSLDSDKYLDMFEDMVGVPLDIDSINSNEEEWMDELDRVQFRVADRVGKAIVNLCRHTEDKVVLQAFTEIKMDPAKFPVNIVTTTAPTQLGYL